MSKFPGLVIGVVMAAAMISLLGCAEPIAGPTFVYEQPSASQDPPASSDSSPDDPAQVASADGADGKEPSTSGVGETDPQPKPTTETDSPPVETPAVEPPVDAPAPETPPIFGKDEPVALPPDTFDEEDKPLPAPPEAKGLRRLAPDYDVWFDKKGRRIVMAGRVVQNRGPLEMFACLRRTKEHESVVAINTKAMFVHAALVALGANPGRPVQFRPEYRAASGAEIDVTVYWSDDGGKRRSARAQDWIRNVKTGKALAHPWVFAGSGFWETKTEQGTQRHYMAEEGDLICISNFPSAMLDLPIASSQADDALVYSAWKDRIPARGTEITVILTPKAKAAGGDKPETTRKDAEPIKDSKPVEAPDPE